MTLLPVVADGSSASGGSWQRGVGPWSRVSRRLIKILNIPTLSAFYPDQMSTGYPSYLERPTEYRVSGSPNPRSDGVP